MAKFNGFGGGNMQQILKQAQMMQAKMEEAREELENTEVIGTAGGSLVEVKVKGNKEVIGISLKPDVVDPSDIQMLEDLIIVALKDAFTKVDELRDEKLGAFSLPGM